MFDLAERVLKEASDFDYAEVKVENSEKNIILQKNGNIEMLHSSKTGGLMLRTIKDGALSAVFINKPEETNISDIISKAKRNSLNAKKILRKKVWMSEEEPNKDKYEVSEKIKLENIGIEEKIKELQHIEKELLNTKLNLVVRYLEYEDEIREKYYVNSEGSKIQSRIPKLTLHYILALAQNGITEQRMLQKGGCGGWEIFKGWNLDKSIIDDAKILTKVISAPKPPKEKMYIILSPELTGIACHENCGHPYEADRILGREAAQAGKSFVKKEMLGTRIGSDVVSVADDPTIENSYGYFKYDDEGLKARRKLLIKNGMINEFLHNRETAAEMNMNSNASSRSSTWSLEPILRMSNTFIVPGDHSFGELTEVNKGIYIKSYMQWNIDDKRFNQRYVGLEAYLIKNGSIEGLVKWPVIEITTPSFYQHIDAVGNDLDFVAGMCGKSEPMQGVPVWFGGPHVRLKDIKLG